MSNEKLPVDWKHLKVKKSEQKWCIIRIAHTTARVMIDLLSRCAVLY